MHLAPATAHDWCAWARAEHHDGRLDRAQAGFRHMPAIDAAAPRGAIETTPGHWRIVIGPRAGEIVRALGC